MQNCVAIPSRILSALAVLLAGCSLLPAQTRSFDLVSFTPPPGWTGGETSDHVTFTTIDNTGGTYVMLAVYSSTAASGNVQRDFASEWTGIVARSFKAGAAPLSIPGRTRQGLEFREGSGIVTLHTGAPGWVRLLVFFASPRMFSVLVVANDKAALDARQSTVREFVDSLSRSQAAVVRQPSTANSGSTASGAPQPGSGITGVWMGFRQLYGSYEPSPRWYTFYSNGQVFEDIPRTGFAGFSPAASQADPGQHSYWGTYSYGNGSGAITKPGVRYPEKILSEGPGRIKIDSDHFYRCAEVNGLRLDGAWTSLANPNDPDLDRWPVGQRPVFRFSSDGRFADEGVFATFLKSGDARLDAAGTGTYEIRDFTLLLRYADGRVKQVAFTGMLGANPAASNDMLFISRSRFRKRR